MLYTHPSQVIDTIGRSAKAVTPLL